MSKYEGPFKAKNGPVFRAGDYSDKGIGVVTEADLYAIAKASNAPAPVNYEHIPGLLDGKLGDVHSFRVEDDPETGEKAIFATWEEPEPLALLLGDSQRTVSAEFTDWRTRKIEAVALAIDPRIDGAAFFTKAPAAYAAFSQGRGVQPLAFAFRSKGEQDAAGDQDMGDPDNKLFPARTAEERDQSMSQLHRAKDPTKVRDRLEKIAKRKKFPPYRDYAYPTRGVSVAHEEPDADDMTASFNSGAPRVGKQNDRPYNDGSEQRNKMPQEATAEEIGLAVKFGKALRSLFVSEEGAGGASGAPAAAKSANELALEARLATLEAEAESAKSAAFSNSDAARATRANEIAVRLLDENRIIPAQLESVKADFKRALDDDAKSENRVTFSVGKGDQAKSVPLTRAESLEAVYSGLPSHNLTGETVRELPAQSQVIFSRETTPVKGAKKEGPVNEDLVTAEVERLTGKKPRAARN